MLGYYATKFSTVEINNSFYHLPKDTTFQKWFGNTPNDFVFSVKASRYITHVKRLKTPEDFEALLDRAKLLQHKLGPFLFQLPPKWSFNRDRLDHFVSNLPAGPRYTFEFRDPSWLNDETYELLRRFNAALCLNDFGGQETPRETLTDFVYLRLHGPGGDYRGQYEDAKLHDWAEYILSCLDRDKTIYCYFDNDEAGYAAKDALRLRNIIESSSRFLGS